VIDPVVRERVIEGYTEKLTPILRREPLYNAETMIYARVRRTATSTKRGVAAAANQVAPYLSSPQPKLGYGLMVSHAGAFTRMGKRPRT
jgi:hypothetical protein